GHLEPLLLGVAEQLLEHEDDVGEGVVVIVEEDDVVRRLLGRRLPLDNVLRENGGITQRENPPVAPSRWRRRASWRRCAASGEESHAFRPSATRVMSSFCLAPAV